MNIKPGDDVWVEDYLCTVMDVSEVFKNGNIRNPDGTTPRGREITLFVEEEDVD